MRRTVSQDAHSAVAGVRPRSRTGQPSRATLGCVQPRATALADVAASAARWLRGCGAARAAALLRARGVHTRAPLRGGIPAGWLIAGLVSTLAGVFFWPRFEQLDLQKMAAAASRAVAQLFSVERMRGAGTEVPAARQAAEDAA